jgi:Lipocalin-like domain
LPGLIGVGPLAGAWRVVSAFVEFADTGEAADTFGPSPQGWIVFTEGGRMFGILTAAGRKDASSQGDFERLFKSMLAYSGAVEVDEQQGKFVNRVDTAWQPGWVGTEQLRYFTVDGDVLRIRSAEQTLPHFGDRRLTSIVTFRRA